MGNLLSTTKSSEENDETNANFSNQLLRTVVCQHIPSNSYLTTSDTIDHCIPTSSIIYSQRTTQAEGVVSKRSEYMPEYLGLQGARDKWLEPSGLNLLVYGDRF